MIPLQLANGMFVGGLLLSATLIGFAAWLHFNERDGWAYEQKRGRQLSTDTQYLARRKRSRNCVHFLFALCGVLILIASVAGPGLVFVAAWSCVAFALMTVMVLAMLDGIRTHVYHRDKLPEIRREIFDGDD